MNPAARRIAAAASLFGFAAVVLGAFCAHALKKTLEPSQLAIFETGVRYQMFHALALLDVALFHDRAPSRALAAAGIFFSAGTVLFSGSLYLLATTAARWPGPVTPLGGLCLITGWTLLFFGVLAKSGK